MTARKVLSGVTLLAVLLVGPAAFATGGGENGGNGARHNCNGRDSCSQTTNNIDKSRTYNKGGTGVGVGIGVGKGGDARAKAVDKSRTYNVNVPIAKGGSAEQSQRQKQGQLQGQVQGQAYNGRTDVSVEGDTVTYEAAASAFGGPGIDVDQIKVDCPIYVQDGVSLGGGVVQGGGGIGWTNAEFSEICALWFAAKSSSGAAREAAGFAAYCETFEQARIENKLCDGWKDKLAGVEPEAEGNVDASFNRRTAYGSRHEQNRAETRSERAWRLQEERNQR